MYGAYCALGCLLLAFVAGVVLVDWSCRDGASCKRSLKAAGYFVVVLSLLGVIGLSYRAMSHACDGCGNSSVATCAQKQCPLRQKSCCDQKSCHHKASPQETADK